MTIKKTAGIILSLALALSMSAAASAEELIAGGETVGIRMSTDGVVVVELTAVETDSGKKSPASDAGLRAGDIIKRLGKEEIGSAEDFAAALGVLDGSETTITVERAGKAKQLNITPAAAADGTWKLGLLLRNEISGVGTLTFYDPETGVYGALGHSISDSATGDVLPLLEGDIYGSTVVGIIRSKVGAPGELCGVTDTGQVLGDIRVNCGCGIFGVSEPAGGKLYETGTIKEGSATILCTVSGDGVGEYSAKISQVTQNGDYLTVTVCITDPRLIDATGGIVQGMSGSPIIQEGKLVGAVTHVFVNDPTRGYGISIQDMLKAAQDCDSKAA